MIKFYNTLTREKQEFIPLNKNEVRIYSCGPTVYDYAHIGNMRAYIFMDTLRRVLKLNGYKLKHAMNITDVGHLTSDSDTGEDKMEKSAKEKQKSPLEIAEFFTNVFLNDIKTLNIGLPEIICKATEHIGDMIECVQKIIENGYGYETSKGVYFDVSKLATYGELSKISLESQLAGARVGVDEEKRNSSDFALWIKAPENHILKWESPWGLCYPGWHIECTAMGRKYLGNVFDIHTGGVDHVTIHHENEIAQSRGITGKNPANFWMHSEFILIDGGKMSKSLGNGYTLATLKENNIEPLAYRLFTFSSHYRNKLNFTWDGVKASQTALNRLRDLVLEHKKGKEIIDNNILEEYKLKFLYAINDDLNMPEAMAIVWEVAKKYTKSVNFYDLLIYFDEVLGFSFENIKEEVIQISQNIQDLLKQRKIARDNKEYKKSDELRDRMKELGYNVLDTKNGQEVEKI